MKIDPQEVSAAAVLFKLGERAIVITDEDVQEMGRAFFIEYRDIDTGYEISLRARPGVEQPRLPLDDENSK